MYGGHAHDPSSVQCRKCGYSHKPVTYLEEYQVRKLLSQGPSCPKKCKNTNAGKIKDIERKICDWFFTVKICAVSQLLCKFVAQECILYSQAP